MSLVLVTSILTRLAALAWSLVLLRRLRDPRMLFLTAMLALMALRQSLTLAGRLSAEVPATMGGLTELPGLAVSFLAFLAVHGLGRILADGRRAHEALHRSREDLRLVMDTIPQRLFWKDRELNFLGCNQAFAEDAGLVSPLDIVGKSDHELAWSPSAEAQRADDREVLEGGRGRLDYVESQELEDGTTRWLRTTKLPLRDRQGRIVGLFGSYQDITEERRSAEALRSSQEQLQHAQRLELVGRLAGGIAHDFNNLLLGISGHAELLLERATWDDQARADAEEISRSVDRAAALTRQLLAFSRRQVLQPRRVDLSEVVTGVESMISRLLGERVRLELALTEQAVVVHADPGQLEQVLLNLAVNARDAMPEGGVLRIETRRCESQEGPMACLDVRDDGEGMEAEVRERAFEPFFTTKDASQGTGLGLSTVHGIVHQSGGHVDIESEPGVGTRVQVRLPLVEGAPEAKDPEPGATGRVEGRGELVLVVEDERQVRELTARVLRESGYRVATASTCAEAEELVERGSRDFAACIVDVVLPDGSGLELAERLRLRSPGARVLHVSGYVPEDHHAETLADRLRFLQKPFRPAELLGRLRSLLDGAPG